MYTGLSTSQRKSAKTSHLKPIFLGARIRLARNLMGFPFPQQASEKQKRLIFDTCSEAIMKLKRFPSSVCLRMDELNELECASLMESHQVSVDLVKRKHGAGVVLNQKNKLACMINEEDHLRLQVLDETSDFKNLWRRLNRFDSSLEAYLDYAFEPNLGYLTACPTNLGTGMRVSAMLHLPGFVLNNQLAQIGRSLNEMGMILRGVYGEQSKAIGHIFQISNQNSLGRSEVELLDQVEKVVHLLVDKEVKARQQLLRNNAGELFDNVGRALGVLRECFEVGADEATNLLSLIILAVDFGFFPEETRETLYTLRQQIQPAHMQLFLKKSLTLKELNRERANMLHLYFAKFPEPNFNKQGKELTYVA